MAYIGMPFQTTNSQRLSTIERLDAPENQLNSSAELNECYPKNKLMKCQATTILHNFVSKSSDEHEMNYIRLERIQLIDRHYLVSKS